MSRVTTVVAVGPGDYSDGKIREVVDEQDDTIHDRQDERIDDRVYESRRSGGRGDGDGYERGVVAIEEPAYRRHSEGDERECRTITDTEQMEGTRPVLDGSLTVCALGRLSNVDLLGVLRIEAHRRPQCHGPWR